jgi:chromosome partitioning protein
MIIVFGGVKGGVGKTTAAVNIAAMRSQDHDVLLIDGDEQASSSDFTSVRNETRGSAGYTAVKLTGAAIRSEGLQLAKKFDDVVIDVGGRDTAGQRAALSIADVLAVPFLPSSFDLWALESVSKLVEEAQAFNDNLQAYTFVNRADPQGRDNDEARELAAEVQNLMVLDEQLGNRKAFRSAAAQGLTVVEFKPRDPKAIAEIEALYRRLIGSLMTSY